MSSNSDMQQSSADSEESPAPRKRIGVLPKLALLFVSCLVALLLVEVGFRIAGYGPDKHLRWFAHPDLHYAPAPNQKSLVLVTTKDEGELQFEVSINSHGQRSEDYELEKQPGEFRVIALGDSLTFGPGVSNPDVFLSVTQENFRNEPPETGSMRLVNTACNGYSTVHYLRWMETQMDTYHPDLVVMCLYIGNDMCIATRSVLFNPVLFPAITRNTAFGHYLLEHHRKQLTKWAQAIADKDEPKFMEPIPADLRKYISKPVKALGYEDKIRLWHHSLTHIRSMVEIADQHDTPIVCLLIPQSYMVSGSANPEDFPLLGWLRRSVERAGMPVIDLVDALTPLGLDGWHSYDPGHFNVTGHAAVGKALADGLRDLGYGK